MFAPGTLAAGGRRNKWPVPAFVRCSVGNCPPVIAQLLLEPSAGLAAFLLRERRLPFVSLEFCRQATCVAYSVVGWRWLLPERHCLRFGAVHAQLALQVADVQESS